VFFFFINSSCIGRLERMPMPIAFRQFFISHTACKIKSKGFRNMCLERIARFLWIGMRDDAFHAAMHKRARYGAACVIWGDASIVR